MNSVFYVKYLYIFVRKCTRSMRIIKNNGETISLREKVRKVISDNEVPESSLAEMLDIDRRAFDEFLKEGKDLKFTQALAIMKFLGMDEKEFIESYELDLKDNINEDKVEQTEKLAYIFDKFDVNVLKEIGIIKKRSKIEDYERQLMGFLGFRSSIYEYDSFAPINTLYSKSKVSIEERKQKKMNEFWIRCSRHSFEQINNPFEYDEELLKLYLPKIHEYTLDPIHGYEKVVLTLFRMGVTVLTQSYIKGIGAFGASMFINGKPCVVVTDMMKKYHKLWMTLFHELYHIINDRQMLERSIYHISSESEMSLFFNEEQADLFACRMLIPYEVSRHLAKVIVSPYRIKRLSEELAVHPSVVYGVYLENSPKEQKNKEFSKYAGHLIGSEIATKQIMFSPIQTGNLRDAIDDIKEKLYNIRIA